MDSNNFGILVEDALDESDFSTVSSILGKDTKEMAEKIQKLEKELLEMKKENGSNQSAEQQFGPSMMEIGWKIGKNIGKMEKEMEMLKKDNVELKNGMAKMMKALEVIQSENVELKEEVGKLGKENAEKNQKMEEMKNEIEGLKSAKNSNDCIIGKMDEAIVKLKERMMELEHMFLENGKYMEKFKAEIFDKNLELRRKIADKGLKLDELKTELNGLKEGILQKNYEIDGKIIEMKEEYERKIREMDKQTTELAFLTKQTADGIHGMELAKYDSGTYKLNAMDCGPILTIHADGFVVNHQSPNVWNGVRANLPIPPLNLQSQKTSIAFYYEVQIINKIYGHRGIGIGFCGPEFSMKDKSMGSVENSFGIYHKKGMWIDGTYKRFGKDKGNGIDFEEGDVIGFGLIHLPSICSMQCFATCNGKFLWKDELPTKYAELELFPALTLFRAGLSIRVNFGQDKWRFEQFNKKTEE